MWQFRYSVYLKRGPEPTKKTEAGIVGSIRDVTHKTLPAALGKALKWIYTKK